MRYKKHYDKADTPFKWCILEKKMIFIGKLTWVLHSQYDSPEERNKVLEELINAL